MVNLATPPDGPAEAPGAAPSVVPADAPVRDAPPRARAPRDRLAELLRREPVRIVIDRRELLIAGGVYLAVAAVGFGVLMVLTHDLGYTFNQVLQRWDSGNYLRVAEHGYPGHLRYHANGIPTYSTLAFFPMLPALIRGAHLLLGVLGVGFPVAGALVSWVLGGVAATGVHVLGRSVLGHRAGGYACVGLWASSPYAFALWVPYSEATFTAFLTWALVALIARRWLTAGVLCALAGTVRPTASVLVGVVALCALWAIVRRLDGWRPWAALGLAPAGLVFSWLYLGSRIGMPLTGWFEAEKAWGQQFDFGYGTLHFLKRVVLYQHTDIRYPVVLALIMLVAVAVVTLAMDRRVPWPLVLALAGAWELMFGTPGSPLSKPRFMLPFLPVMLLLLARPVARLPRLVQGCLYGSGAIFAGWYAVGLLMRFTFSP